MRKYWNLIANGMERTEGNKLDPFEYIIVIVAAILLFVIFVLTK